MNGHVKTPAARFLIFFEDLPLLVDIRPKSRRGEVHASDATVAALCEAAQKEGTSSAQNLAATSRPVRIKSGKKLRLPEKAMAA
jgi:hypothetical protein